jgi:5-methylcytosine-specific restriction protein A
MLMFRRLTDLISGKVQPFGLKRSPKWPKVRATYLGLFPTCAVCGGKKLVEVHHIKPFHLFPELELDQNNLITLCEDYSHTAANHHCFIGHLGQWKNINPDVIADAGAWNKKLIK